MGSRSRGTTCLLLLSGVLGTAPRVALAQGPLLVRYPYLQNVGADRATLLWATRETGSGAVETRAGQGAPQTFAAAANRLPDALTGLSYSYYQYRADLTGLRPDTEYSYRVLQDGRTLVQEDGLRFRTAGPPPFRFLVFGDSGVGSPEQRAVAQGMLREQAALVLHVGDLAYPNGTFPLLQTRYLDIYQGLMKLVPFFATPGNHEYDTDNAAPYLAIHAPPADGVPAADRGRYYSFDWGNAQFVSLDTNLPLTQATEGRGPMLEWLDQDLARTRQPWRVVLLQHPPFPTSVHETDPICATVRQRVLPILERYNVQVTFGGHEHNYQQSQPIRNGQYAQPGEGIAHVITGGGGAPLYPVAPRPGLVYAESAHHYLRVEVSGPRLTVHAIRVDGQEIDTFTLNLPSPPTPPPAPPAPAPNPITVEAAVNAASFTPALAPGSLVSIFGKALARSAGGATSLPLPDTLSGTVVTLNGRRLPLLYVSSTQINAELPYDFDGPASLRVTTPDGSAEKALAVADAAPAIFLAGSEPVVVRPATGALISPSAPALPGEALTLYLTGLGRPDGDLAPGQPAPAAPLILARGPIQIQIGDRSVTPLFAGCTPGFTGLYQINFVVPPDLAAGNQTLRVTVRGASSNEVSLAVQSQR